MGTNFGAGAYVPDEGELPPGATLGRELAAVLPKALDDRLRAYCTRTGLNRSRVARIALGRYLAADEAQP